MISGIVQNNTPIARISIGTDIALQDVLVLVDTGFTGDLKISPKKASLLGLYVSHSEEIKLADQQKVMMDACFATVQMERIKEEVNVLVSPGFAMIGIGLLRKFRYNLAIDLEHDVLKLERY